MKLFTRHITFFLFLCFLSTACEMSDQYNSSPRRNFEALWSILDENYCFFEYKNVDWDEVYDHYSPMVYDEMDESALFNILSSMANELEDGHINLIASYRVSFYEGWSSGATAGFDIGILYDHYLSDGYSSYNDIIYTTFENGRIGYIFYQSFTESILETDLNQIFETFKNCEGIILDVRDNGGGSISNSDRLASRFFHKKQLCGYIQHKTGKGRSDFSSPYPIYLGPSHATLWPQEKPVVVLTSRRCYSATNNFVAKMMVLPNVTIIGDRTGGGSGFPFTSELPNGWGIRFSTSPILDTKKQHTEFGIDPDITIQAAERAGEHPADPTLDYAISFLKEK